MNVLPAAPDAVAGLVRPNTDDWSIFVGDLAPDVTDAMLQSAFAQFYSSVRSAKVIVDPATGRSKGYGFVRFAAEGERDKSLEMQGYTLCNRPIRVSLATARRSPSAGMPGTHPAELDPTNTTLFIGGLSAGITEDQLRAIFIRFGDVVYTKIPQGKGCGFVQFVSRADAEAAMAEMNGQVIGSTAIRISWGRSTSRAAALAPAGAAVAGLAGGARANMLGAAAAFPAAGLAGLGAGLGNGLMGFPAAVTAGFDAPGAFGGGVGLQQPSAGLGGMFGGGLGVQQPHGGLGGGGGGGGGFDLGGGGGGGGGLGYGSPLSNGNGMPAVSATDALLFRGQPMAAGLGGFGVTTGLACLPPQQQLFTGTLQPQQLQQQQAAMFDSMGAMDIGKLNALFMQRQQPALSGGYMRPVG